MKPWRWIAVIALTAVITVIAIVAIRTVRLGAVIDPPDTADLAPARTFDVNAAAGRLSQAVRFQTVRHQDPREDRPQAWSEFQTWLSSTYPHAHRAMRLERVGGPALVYAWPGSDSRLAPIVLMAHHDVVPAQDPGWSYPPFAGVVAGGAVWGRGSVDDKGSLIALFEALEGLAESGFRPTRTVIVISGGDEEVGGRGAQAAAEWMRRRHLRAQFVLDEGMVVIEDHPLAGGQAAIIGVAEKGRGTLRITAMGAGGHASAPPSPTSVEVLSRAVLAIMDQQAPLRLSGPSAGMVHALAPHSGLGVRVAAANTWLLGAVLLRQAGKSPIGSAMFRTTMAPTMLEASPKENVLAARASARINVRIAPGDTAKAVMDRALEAVEGLPVEVTWNAPPVEPSRVSSTDSAPWRVLAALAAHESDAPVAPGLVMAGTDSRFLEPVAEDVYRFQPIILTTADSKMLHGVDEHLTFSNLARLITFYQRLIETTAGPSAPPPQR